MKTILVPTDFSPLSLKALDRAVELAIPAQASILLLGVVKYPEPILMDAHAEGSWDQDMDDAFEERVESIENRLRCLLDQPKYHQVPISAIVNRQMSTIGETIASSKADLIVMASEGATGWKEKTTGSNAERVVRYAKCPVLIIKNAEPISYQKVLFPTDFTNTKALHAFFAFADVRKAHPHFLTVNTGYLDRSFDDLEEDMTELAVDLKLESYSYAIIDAVSEEAGIIRYAEEINADLIALYTHGRTGLSHWFHGSIAEKVVNHSEVPVLTLVQQ
ncbi:universal stress protein [Siphonobacter sp. SORGH_AS_0500]|uniref:universal stress protein n=1 Tax=Siphonobacter sp. SORGH_AS_0500 TaxID=1864824 RepID=UPI0028593F17|nr:universal stress protein [Siphonobacter sp. SORGH_AS_0500]MDR6195090.1 nucleotide-binding universal stress UspA family protein [Siphonobacter sp. SORGH_AS_0500]